MTDDEPGLRERKKRETRRLLTQLAIEMFAERGFEVVTVAEIAAAANVSDKTVFNYFPTKEDLVLDGRDEIEAALIQAVQDRPPGEPILATVKRHTLAIAARMNAAPPERRAAFRKVIASTPSLHERMRQLSLRYEDQIAKILTEETGAAATDATPRVVASVLGVLTRLGFGLGPDRTKRWRHAEVIANIEAVFDLFERGLASYAVRGRR